MSNEEFLQHIQTENQLQFTPLKKTLVRNFRELILKFAEIRSKFWSYYFPVEMAFATGAFYEIIEWIYAITDGDPATGHAFLGSQGDIWDAQVDMFLAGIGAIVTMIIIAIATYKKKKIST